jgi:hypothetical protein
MPPAQMMSPAARRGLHLEYEALPCETRLLPHRRRPRPRRPRLTDDNAEFKMVPLPQTRRHRPKDDRLGHKTTMPPQVQRQLRPEINAVPQRRWAGPQDDTAASSTMVSSSRQRQCRLQYDDAGFKTAVPPRLQDDDGAGL